MCKSTETVHYVGVLTFLSAKYKAKIKTLKNVISLVISCGCTAWSATVRELENMLLAGSIWG
jgi:hypothetical protein